LTDRTESSDADQVVDGEGGTIAAPVRAAGIMHIVDGKVLLVLRSPAGDHGGEWAFPGGKIEDGETPAEAALRECREELGLTPQGELEEHLRRIKNGVDFTTFLQRGTELFEPDLNDEHLGYIWVRPSEVPVPLHPGCQVAIDKLGWNELDTARAIRDGDMVSPARYMNVWLFDLRITGSGAAFRVGAQEFTWRDPSVYLNDEMLMRCNGLPVIYEHPEEVDRLNSEEFSDRVCGTIVLPYIRDQEIWGVAKIYDDNAAAIMRTRQMSTSPCVIVRKGEDAQTIPLDDGVTLLIEGQPMLLDHLAICEQGVWDKGNSPSGVNFTGDAVMADKDDDKKEDPKAMAEEKKEDAKADDNDPRVAQGGAGSEAEGDKDAKIIEEAGNEGTRLNALFSKIDSKLDGLSSRMDAFDGKAKADSSDDDDDKKDKADDKKEDAKADSEDDDDKKDEKKDMDEAKSDSAIRALKADNAAMKRQLETITRNMPKHLSDADYTSLADAQARADRVLSAFGDSASRPLQGEDLGGYRRRLATGLQKHSGTWAKVDLVALPDSAFEIAEEQIFKDSAAAAMNPVDIEPGVLRQITSIDKDTNVRTHTFVGKNTFIAGMTSHGQAAMLMPPSNARH
jgi:8-oxo-dGTP pyrophosphatase MutT (NUDIX family)